MHLGDIPGAGGAAASSSQGPEDATTNLGAEEPAEAADATAK